MVLAFTSFHVALLGIAAAFFVAAAVSDAVSYRIPNELCAFLLLFFPLHVLSAPTPVAWGQHVLVFIVVLTLGFGAFIANLAGAGDIKLLSVASLWAGPKLVLLLLGTTAIAGGIVAIIFALFSRQKAHPTKKISRLRETPIPYGIAIATGSLAVLGTLARPLVMPEY